MCKLAKEGESRRKRATGRSECGCKERVASGRDGVIVSQVLAYGYLVFVGLYWYQGQVKDGSQLGVRLVRKDCSRYVARPTSPHWSQPKTLPPG